MGRTRGTESETPISPPPQPQPWIELPGDVTANILQRLGAEEILKSAEKVCTTWKKVCLDPSMWRAVNLKKPFVDDERKFDLMCRCAVDRSQGQLTDLSISCFGEDELLNFVADRSSDLRRLTLTYPGCGISAFGLAAAVKKLSQLEELHLNWIRPLKAEDVETIGISCPLLNSFTYNEKWEVGFDQEYDRNGIAIAIAKTMPNLHHLQLGREGITDEGLEAILDGCPHLDAIDILFPPLPRFRSGNALILWCSKQFRFLRFPIEPSYDDFETSCHRFDALKFKDFYDKYSHDLYHDHCR